jgi:hypothetical protein
VQLWDDCREESLKEMKRNRRQNRSPIVHVEDRSNRRIKDLLSLSRWNQVDGETGKGGDRIQGQARSLWSRTYTGPPTGRSSVGEAGSVSSFY